MTSTDPGIEELRERLELAGVAPALVERAIQGTRRGIRLELVPKDRAASRLGASRLGGMPDLAPGLVRPIDPTGEPLAFLGQLNLNELASADAQSRLPAVGLLSMFVGTWIDSAGEPQLHAKLFHFEDLTGIAPVAPARAPSRAVGLRFVPAMFLPPHASVFMPWDERYAEAFEEIQGLEYQRHGMFGFDRPDENVLAEDDELLLRLGYGREVPYDFVEAAVLLLILPGGALEARRWGELRAVEGHSI